MSDLILSSDDVAGLTWRSSDPDVQALAASHEALRAQLDARNGEVISMAQAAARLAVDAELIVAADPTTYGDPGFRAGLRAIVKAAENALCDDRFVADATGEHTAVVEATEADEANRVPPTMPQEGQR